MGRPSCDREIIAMVADDILSRWFQLSSNIIQYRPIIDDSCGRLCSHRRSQRGPGAYHLKGSGKNYAEF